MPANAPATGPPRPPIPITPNPAPKDEEPSAPSSSIASKPEPAPAATFNCDFVGEALMPTTPVGLIDISAFPLPASSKNTPPPVGLPITVLVPSPNSDQFVQAVRPLTPNPIAPKPGPQPASPIPTRPFVPP